MKKKIIISLSCCFLLGVSVVAGLYAMSEKIVHGRNSFMRDYRHHAAVLASTVDLGFNSWYVAGVDEQHIYFGNVKAPLRMIVSNLTLTDTTHLLIKLKDPQQKLYNKTRVTVEPPYFFIEDGLGPALLRGKIGEWKAERFMYDTIYFNRAIPIGPNSFAIRSNSAKTQNHMLGKIQDKNPHVVFDTTLLQRQIDGLFCTDGSFVYNKELKKLIYFYYYRNGFIVYDTSLNLIYRGHTLDTFNTAQIKVGYVKSDKSRVLTSKSFVNRSISTAGHYLFVNSALLAKNDLKNVMKDNSVLDVYDLNKNQYLFSFTLAQVFETKAREFTVIGNQMVIGMFDHYAARFDLQQKYF